MFRSWRTTAADAGRGARERALDARPLLADGIHLQRAQQHARPARRRARDRRRRAHRAALQRSGERDGDRADAFNATVSDLACRCWPPAARPRSGMLSLATSHVHAVRAFGIGAAVGVMVDFAISLVLVPTLLTLIKPSALPPPQERWLLGPMRRVARLLLPASRARDGRSPAVIAVVAMVGVLRGCASTPTTSTSSRAAIRCRARRTLIDRKLSGVYSVPGLLRGAAESMRTRRRWRGWSALGQAIGRLPNVRKVISLVDYVEAHQPRLERRRSGGGGRARIARR